MLPVAATLHCEDRVALNEGSLRRNGTQIADVVDGHPVLWPCLDPAHVDELRADVAVIAAAICEFCTSGRRSGHDTDACASETIPRWLLRRR